MSTQNLQVSRENSPAPRPCPERGAIPPLYLPIMTQAALWVDPQFSQRRLQLTPLVQQFLI